MLTIRLSRIGKHSQPSFKVILQEHRKSPKSASQEIFGSYDPKSKAFTVKKERIEYWISKGAKPSSTMAVLLKKNGLTNMDKYITMGKHQKKKKKEQAADAAAPVTAPTPAKEAAPAPAAEAPKP